MVRFGRHLCLSSSSAQVPRSSSSAEAEFCGLVKARPEQSAHATWREMWSCPSTESERWHQWDGAIMRNPIQTGFAGKTLGLQKHFGAFTSPSMPFLNACGERRPLAQCFRMMTHRVFLRRSTDACVAPALRPFVLRERMTIPTRSQPQVRGLPHIARNYEVELKKHVPGDASIHIVFVSMTDTTRDWNHCTSSWQALPKHL